MLRRPVLATSRPLRVAVLTSRRAPGLAQLLEEDADRGRRYDIVTAIASEADCGERARLAAAGVPSAIHDFRAFCRDQAAKPCDLAARRVYDRGTLALLAPAQPDLVLLCGYLHLVTAPLLEAYPGRVVNVHDSDLTLLDQAGLPRYRGLHATYDAVAAGEAETRSCAHLVTPELDTGPVIVRSWGFPTHPLVDAARRWGATDILKAYAYAQREWMMHAAWGPLLARVIALFADDQVGTRRGRLTIGGTPGPLELAPEHARPAVCAGVGA